MDWNLRVLEWIQGTRTPFRDGFFSIITRFGEETILIPILCTLFWCVHKRFAYRVSFAFFCGTFVNQLLKVIFCIPRPWLLKSTLQPVESAVEGASGYSFPSGHTSSATGIYGGIACNVKKWPVIIPFGILTLLVAYSRLYLGVHTPLDVGVALMVSLLLLFAAPAILDYAERKKNGDVVVLAGGMILCLLSLAYILLCARNRGDDPELFYDAYKAVGGGLGYFIGWFVESRVVRFEEKGPVWFQIVKVVIGVLLLLGIQQGLKSPLVTLLGPEAGHLIRYLLLIFVALALYPWLFARIKKRIVY